MDIAALSMALSTNELKTDASICVLSKSMELNETAGDNLIKMMEQSVQPNLGQNIDIAV